jgi:hypothetical protein
MKTIALSFDDFSVLNNRLDLLSTLKEHYPKLKVTMFTIPFDYESENTLTGNIMRADTLKKIQDNLDWIQIVPHGLLHLPREFEKCTYETMKENILPAIDEQFKKDGLPYEKGFKAPYWLWNEGVVKALDEAGWWGAVDKNQPLMLRTKKFYVYSHSIADPFWTSNLDTLKLHGHITSGNRTGDNIDNGIENCFLNLMKLPDADFKFVSEMIETK